MDSVGQAELTKAIKYTAPMMAKPPAKSEPARSDEYDRFEETLRKLVAVPKRDIDAAVERERQARGHGNDSK